MTIASNSRFSLLLAAMLLAAHASAATPAEPVDIGKGRKMAAEMCAPCHNADGNSVITSNPKLAGLPAEYIVKQLTDLAKPPGDKTGRENPVMGGIASTLSPADRENLAAWFSSQTPVPGKATNPETVRFGQRLYRAGLPEKAVPACAGCHGPSGNGLPVRFPKISGQHAEYIEAQLHAFHDGTRHNSEPMMQIGFRLNDSEMKALADYIAGLQPQ